MNDEHDKCPTHDCELIEEESEVWTGKYKNVLEIRTEWVCPQCEALRAAAQPGE